LRLLIVTQYFWPENLRINDLVGELVKRGHDLTVLTGKPNYPGGKIFPEYLEHPQRFKTYAGARIVRVPLWLRGSRRTSLFLNYVTFAMSAIVFGIPRLREHGFDAIFVFQVSPVTVGLPAIALRRVKRCPVALWVLDQWPESLSALGIVTSGPALRLLGSLVSFIYNRCDLVLAQSKSLVPLIGKYSVYPGRVSYFPSWAEAAFGEHDTAAPAPEVPPQSGCFTVMFAGNIGESQDFPTILDAAEALAAHGGIRWLIIGDGRMADWVRGEALRRGLHEQFILLGRYPLERMPSFYRHADALLVSLRPEPVFAMTLPGKVQSYLAAGIPIVGMIDGESAAVIRDAGAGIAVPAGNAQALCAAVLRLSRLPESERRTMGERGRAYNRREFDRDLLVGRLESWLLDLAQKHRA
jgi:glycosyltransferase involved in cell wall biosynthesis